MIRPIWLAGQPTAPARTGNVDRPTVPQMAIWVALMLIAVGLALANFNAYQLGTHLDDARYVILANSMAHSDVYGMINAPGEPGVAKFPFGYPLLLAPLVSWFPDNPDLWKLPSLLANLINASILFWGWRWISREKSHWWALILVGLYLLSPITVDMSRRVMSEPVFTTFCLMAIVLAGRYAAGQHGRGWTTWMSVALTFAVFTRTIGVVLVLCVAAYVLWLKRARGFKDLALIALQSAALLAVIVALTPVRLRDLLPVKYLQDENARLMLSPFGSGTAPVQPVAVPSAQPDSQPASPAAGPAAGGLSTALNLLSFGVRQHLGRDVRAVAFPFGGGDAEQSLADRLGVPQLPASIGYLTSLLVLIGWLRHVRYDGLSLFIAFGAIYFAVLFLWIWNDSRMLYPIQFQIHLGFLLGLKAIALAVARILRLNQPMEHRRPVLNALVVFVLLVAGVQKSLSIADSRLHAGDMQARSEWLRLNAGSDAVVMTEAPDVDFLYTRLKMVAYPPRTTSTEQLDALFSQYNVRFVLVAPRIRWQTIYEPEYSGRTQSFLDLAGQLSQPGCVELVYEPSDSLVRVYRVNPDIRCATS